jgi:transcriptional regulator with XRE-family HTH domain
VTWRNRLRFAIARSGKAHDDVAFAAGLSSAGLRDILEGSDDPDLEEMARIAAVLRVSMASLVGERPASEVTARRVVDEEIPPHFAARGATLVYEAAGDVLTAKGIIDGDLLFVRPTGNASGAADQVVVCRAGSEELVRLRGDAAGVEVIGVVIGRMGAID